MSIITLVILLLFLASVLWFVNAKGASMNATMKLILNIVLIAIAILLVLSAFGIWDQIKSMQVPKLLML